MNFAEAVGDDNPIAESHARSACPGAGAMAAFAGRLTEDKILARLFRLNQDRAELEAP